MWQKFTEDARGVIIRAQAEAIKVRSLVDTEHLLLGLFIQNEVRIASLLASMGVDASAVRAEAVSAINQSLQKSEEEEPKLTPKAKWVLELAADEARRMRHNYIGTEHLLLGLVRGTSVVAYQILQAQGADLEKARAVVVGIKELAGQKASYRVTSLSGIEFKQEIADVLEGARYWANLSQGNIGAEELLLSLLERRADLGVEILGLDGLALKKARLQLLVRLDLQEQAATLRDEIESEQS